jgi:site-specific recombinase XerD
MGKQISKSEHWFRRRHTLKKIKQNKEKRGMRKSGEYTIIIEEFLTWRKEQGFRDRNGMRKNVKKLIGYLEDSNIELNEVKVRDAQEYQGWLLKTRKPDGGAYDDWTVYNFIKAAIAFFHFLKKTGRVGSNPFAVIRRRRVNKKVPRNVLSEKEMNALLEAFGRFDEVKGLRNRKVRYRLHVLVELLYSTGMRIGEAAMLKGDEIDFSRGVVEFKDIKGGHDRRAFLNDYAAKVLTIYNNEMREHTLFENNDKQLLFGAKASRLLLLLNERLAAIAKEQKLPHITSHGFRHAFGTHFLRRGCSIRYIQELLGHRQIASTEVYTRIDRDRLKQVFDECHPRKFEGGRH